MRKHATAVSRSLSTSDDVSCELPQRGNFLEGQTPSPAPRSPLAPRKDSERTQAPDPRADVTTSHRAPHFRPCPAGGIIPLVPRKLEGHGER
jgi:hypothetical protein